MGEEDKQDSFLGMVPVEPGAVDRATNMRRRRRNRPKGNPLEKPVVAITSRIEWKPDEVVAEIIRRTGE